MDFLRIKNSWVIYFLALFIILNSLFIIPAFAQTDTSNVFDIADQEAKAGDILIYDPTKGIVRANNPYDNHLFGILQDKPALVYRRVDQTGQAVMMSGITSVNVTSANGDIKKGDYITSSTVVGLGMKADQSGYVVGTALGEFSGGDQTQNCKLTPDSCPKGEIEVAIKIDYADITNPRSINRLFEYIGTAFFKNSQDPEGFGKIIKNAMSGLIMLICIVVGLLIIGRSIPKSIEAIGRNPLAKRSIQFTILINIIIVIFVVVGGIAAALIILKL